MMKTKFTPCRLTVFFIVSLISITIGCKKAENKVELPTLSTLAVTDITANEAKSGGNISSDGGAPITARGVVWGTTKNPAIEQHAGITNDGTGTGMYSSNLTDLQPETTYYVRAYATNSAGTAYGSQVQFTTETAGSAPEAAFTATTTSGTAPLTVNFTDQSTNNPTSWAWDFGDGSTSTQQNPQHTYQNSGTYTVALTVSNSHGSDTETKTNYIQVNQAGSAPVAAFTATPTSGTAPLIVNFTDQSTNNPTSWQWNFGDGNSSTQQNPQHTYQNAGTYTVALTVTNSHGSDTETKTNYIAVTSGGGGFNDVYNPATGKTWMDRNLGAGRVAQSSTDAEAYGDLYQWGRLTDGHENRNSPTTSTLSSSDVPGHGNFITVNSSPYDWLSPQNNNLWQGVSGTNNPCPAGYRLPTEAEWEAERQSWSSNTAAGAFYSPLKLPVAGLRRRDGSLYPVGSVGLYWSATVDGTHARALAVFSFDAFMSSHARAIGHSVRCLKD